MHTAHDGRYGSARHLARPRTGRARAAAHQPQDGLTSGGRAAARPRRTGLLALADARPQDRPAAT
jgi:hypothetical protein